jgi:hypothetical protein
MKKTTIEKIAKSHDWKFHDYQENIGMISFVKIIDGDPARINIYVTKMTVATCINHPRKGKTQLFRKHVDEKLLKLIFENPRVHTPFGYREK